MDWKKIWNRIEINNLNGYLFNSNFEYIKFIEEITNKLHIKDDIKILDIGCGNGEFIHELLKIKKINNCNVYGLDFNEKSINYANKNFKGNYIVHDIKKKLPYQNNEFDLVICVGVLFYLNNEEQLKFVLNEIRRVSKKTSTLFLGSCMDEEKKELSLNIRKKTHSKSSVHLYINKKFLKQFFLNNYIEFNDYENLDLDFYSSRQYKYYAIIKFEDSINIGLDYHDTISAYPVFFNNILKNWNGKRVIITGTPLSKKKETINKLKNDGFFQDINYDIIEFGYEYNKKDMDYSHFEKMKIHKLNIINKYDIKIYFDDNPYYVNYLKNFCEAIFQPILSSKYIEYFNKQDRYFCCNLQENQFNYLDNFNKKKKILVPGVFDLFHYGHIKLLNNIKKIYNCYLVVAVHEDESAKKYKNKYPINNCNERMDFIRELNIINEVIVYDDIDLSKILKDKNIDILIIGPEYGKYIEHEKTLDYCKKNNIEVKLIDRTKNISTTKIINKIKLNK